MKIHTRILLITIGVLSIITNIVAQTAPLTGKVQIVQPDGTTTPVSGALIEVFRVDIKGKYPTNTTDQKGQFAFAGLPLGAVFMICVSAPGVKAECLPGIKAGMENLAVTMVSGDGRRLTEEEARQIIISNSTGSRISKLNTDGFMGIKYGASMAEAERIITAGKLGKIEKRYSDGLEISGGKTNYAFESDASRYTFLDDLDILLLFVNDKFYQATILYEMSEDLYVNFLTIGRGENPFKFDVIKKDFDRIYHPADVYEDGAKGLGTAIWEFKQPQGKPNYIQLSQENNRMTLTFQNTDLFEVAEQKEKDIENAKISYGDATSYYMGKKYDLAVIEYTKTLKLNPDHVNAYHYRGHSYAALKKYDLAVADFTSALKYEPENTHYLNDRAAAYAAWSADKFDLALADLAKAIKIKPNDARPYLQRARIFCAQGKKVLAAADEKDAVSLGGEVVQKCEQ